MTEPILMALVQLFATVAATAGNQAPGNSRLILESYLREQLNSLELEEYLKLFDELLFFHMPADGGSESPQPDISGKISAICGKIYKDLGYLDRLIVFMKFTEFLDEISRTSVNLPLGENQHLLGYTLLLKASFSIPDNEYQLLITPHNSMLSPKYINLR